MESNRETPVRTTRCQRCGRKIKRGPYGEKCARMIRRAALDAARAGFTAGQQARADELIRDGGMVPVRMTARNGMLFRAVSSRGDETYLVTANGCARIARRACYHQLSARVLTIASRRSLAKAA